MPSVHIFSQAGYELNPSLEWKKTLETLCLAENENVPSLNIIQPLVSDESHLEYHETETPAAAMRPNESCH